MKKIVFLIAGLVSLGTMCYGQYSVGDIYELDGTKALVLHVDEDGLGGLVMAPLPANTAMSAFVQKKLGKINKEEFKELRKKEKAAAKASQKIFAQRSKMMDLFGSFTDDGADNMQKVLRYCEEKGLALDEYFPEYANAKAFGEGWFIPGAREAEYYAQIIGDGLGGKKYKSFNGVKFDKKVTGILMKYTAEGLNLSRAMKVSSVHIQGKKIEALVFTEMYRQGDMKKWFALLRCPFESTYRVQPLYLVKEVAFDE